MTKSNTTSTECGETDVFLDTFLPGTSPGVTLLRAEIARLNVLRSRTLVPIVLITGESGVGKNHLALTATAHQHWLAIRGSDGDLGLAAGIKPYLSRFSEIHLPGLPDELIESELFGHKKGAFTGADTTKTGLLVEGADGILLDEIGDISSLLQTKLLGVLERRRCRPVGGRLDDEQDVRARLFMATNRSLPQMIRDGKFREDLYYRAAQFVLRVPPLREQPENIEPLVRRIEEDIRLLLQESFTATSTRSLSGDDLEWARRYPWPGNVRQLRHAIQRWFVYDGECSLRHVVEEVGGEGELRVSTAGMDLNMMVASGLDAALATGTSAAPTLDGFIRQYTRDAQEALVTWYQTRKPGPDQLQKLFPGHTGVDSIRNQLSKWRKK